MSTTEYKPHLSATQINMFMRCGAQYYFRYIEGIKLPPGGALVLGRAVDGGLNHNYIQKIKTHTDLQTGEILDVYSDIFDLEKGDAVWDDEEKPAEAKDCGYALLKKYQATIAPTIQPAAVQEEFKVGFKDFKRDLVGKIDLIDDEGVVIDNKTKGKSPNKGEVAGSYKVDAADDIQLGIYALGYRLKNKKPETGLRIDYLVKSKVPQIVQVPIFKTNDEVDFVLRLLGRVSDAIDKGVFLPNRAGMLCSKKWCGYYDKCHKEF